MSKTTTQTELSGIGPKELGTVIGDSDDQEVIGQMMYCTTGNTIVSNEWLSAKFREHDVPARFLPDLPANWSAYTRAMRFLIHPGISDEFEVDGRNVKVEMLNGEGKTKFIEAREFIPEDECEVEDGEWIRTKLGKIDYDKDKEEIMYQSLMDGYEYAEVWGSLVKRSEQLFSRLKTSAIDSDLRGLLTEFRGFSNSITLRDAGVVYFVPSHHSDLLNGISAVWNDMDDAPEQHVMKMGGEKAKDVEMRKTVVFNTEEKRNVVERQVERRIEDEVKDALVKAFNRVEQDDVVEKIVSGVIDSVEESETLADEYSLLLNSKLSVQNIMEDLAEDMAEEQHQELVEELEGEME